MLETIKTAIQELKDDKTDFYSFFNDYVMQVQNESIVDELNYMRLHNVVNPVLVDREINSCVEELKKLW